MVEPESHIGCLSGLLGLFEANVSFGFSEVVVVGVAGEDHGPVDGQFVVVSDDYEGAFVFVGSHVSGFDHFPGGHEGLEAGGGLGAVGLV